MEECSKLQFYDRTVEFLILRFIPPSIKPNQITILRIIATPFVIWLVLNEFFLWGIILFLIAAFTDMIDGTMARSRNQITNLGRILDPVADKLLIGSLAVTMIIKYLSYNLAIIIIILEILFLIGGYLRKRQGLLVEANWWGKIKMNLQVLGTLLLLISIAATLPVLIPWVLVIFYLAIIFAILSLLTHGF